MAINGFDIQKKSILQPSHFTDLRKFSKKYLPSMLIKNLCTVVILHITLYFILHVFYFKSPLSHTHYFYLTLTNSSELLTTNLFCSIFITINYLLAALFREKKDYATIHAWYAVALVYSILVVAEVLWFGIQPTLLLQNSLLAMLAALTIAQLIAIIFYD